MRSFLALATLALSSYIVSADNTWSLWFNGQDDCAGSSYNVAGTNDAGCTRIDAANFPYGALDSVLVDSTVPSGYCKLVLYGETDCELRLAPSRKNWTSRSFVSCEADPIKTKALGTRWTTRPTAPTLPGTDRARGNTAGTCRRPHRFNHGRWSASHELNLDFPSFRAPVLA